MAALKPAEVKARLKALLNYLPKIEIALKKAGRHFKPPFRFEGFGSFGPEILPRREIYGAFMTGMGDWVEKLSIDGGWAQ